MKDRVVIVGGGVIGLCCAWYLQRDGFRVTVVDRGDIGGGCSHGNCGYICPSHVLPLTEPGMIGLGLKSLLQTNAPFRVAPRIDPGLWQWMLQFARRCNHRDMLRGARALKPILDLSLQAYQDLVAGESLDCEWREEGLLYVFKEAAGLESFARMDAMLTREFGVSANRVDGAGLLALDSALRPGLAGGFHYPEDASIRPDAFNHALLERCRAEGVAFQEQMEVTGLMIDGPKTSQGSPRGLVRAVQTSSGELETDQVVLAAGALSGQLGAMLRCRIPVQPGKGYSITMRPPEPAASLPMLFPETRVGVTPMRDAYRLGSMMEFSGYDATIPQSRIDLLRRGAEPYLLSPHTDEITERWFGWRPMTWDSLPIIGPTPRLANAWLATGHNMIGQTLGPATGVLLAAMMSQQEPPIDPTPYSVNRLQ